MGQTPPDKEPHMTFQAFEFSLELIRSLDQTLAILDRRDPDLARQLRRAAASVSLNLSEGNRRNGKDRIHLWRIAAGSAAEVAASLRVAEAFGYLQAGAIAKSLAFCDSVLAMLWRLTH
jgi:four helix bundle protein